MKRKVLALILAISCILSITACGGKEPAKEAEVQETVEENTEEPTEEPTVEPTEEPTVEPTEEPTPEVTPEPEAEGEVEEAEDGAKPATDMPANLSDDLYDFQVSIDGTVYQFPMWYSDFEALGWEYTGDNTQTLSSNQYTAAEVWKKDGVTVYTSFANLSMNSAAFTDCMVCGITLEKYNLKDCGWEIILPGGIQYGVSDTDAIKAAYGDPSSDYDGSNYYKMSYEYDTYNDIELYVYKDSGVLEEIEIRNIVELEGADNSVDETVPEIVKNYQAPEELGTDLYSFNVEFEGNLYTLPCPVSEFVANGFKIDENNTDMEIAAGSFGWVDLRYNNQTLHVIARNYADYATVIDNCFVVSVESSDYDPKFDLVIPGNIKRGDNEATVKAAIEGFHYETETSDSGYTYYEIYDPNGSKLDSYSITIKDDAVISIEVENSENPEK